MFSVRRVSRQTSADWQTGTPVHHERARHTDDVSKRVSSHSFARASSSHPASGESWGARELARDRIGASPLFRDGTGERPSRWWLAYWCKRLCKLGKVPEITPQGFRGTHGSIARRGGATGRIVQEQFGHASLAMTEGGAYVQRSAIEAADVRAVELRLLKGGRGAPAGKTQQKTRAPTSCWCPLNTNRGILNVPRLLAY